MTYAASLLVAAPIVGLAAVLAVFVTRLVDVRHPLPDGPAGRDPEETVGIPRHWVLAAADEGERRRARAAAVPARASVAVLDPSRAGWLFTDRPAVFTPWGSR